MEYYELIGKEITATASSIGEPRKFTVEYIHPDRGYKLQIIPTLKEQFFKFFSKEYKYRASFHLCVGSKESYLLCKSDEFWKHGVSKRLGLPESFTFDEVYKISISIDCAVFKEKFIKGEEFKYSDIHFNRKLNCPSDFDFTKEERNENS